ncbi:Zn-ribbon domain-containing OB-fold protein [Kribbella solani]|uniref:Zn-ribbon domain-containing OB-fold protein n=1 Tax=Kribbella solani TaxID=236067 RepID=UPI001620157F|nr:OB-fold domain-containing protein [Kribbella solani]MDX2972724.1 OB-fold domain-containing protein [Kribbella solani]MDX3005596.1 OB-fold domain-containing protein [Kribbella solani]
MKGSGPPLPVPDADSAPFWAGCAQGRVRAQRCTGCGRWRHPPAEFCPGCHSQAHEWVELPGSGVVRSWVVVHRVLHPALGKVPYVLAEVVLDGTDGQVVLTTKLLGCRPGDVRIGLPVAAEFTPVSPEIALPTMRGDN